MAAAAVYTGQLQRPHALDWSRECMRRGNGAEVRFKELAQARGWDVAPASRYEDLRRHVDQILTRETGNEDKQKLRVDVKARKKVSRGDAACQDELIWLELAGVNKGNRGWLYGSDADAVAFETTDGFMVVDRLELIKFVDKHVDRKQRVATAREAVYKVYCRRGRLDELSLVPLKDILASGAAELWLDE